MDCCGGGLTRRQWMWSAVLASAGSALAGCAGQGGGTATVAPAPAAAASPAALRVLKDHVSVDVHSHAGSTGIVSGKAPSDDAATGMRAGGLASVCLADVPDAPLLGRKPSGGLAALREATPGQLYGYHLGRMAWITSWSPATGCAAC